MKVYISVDIEGVTGITHWDEAEIGKPGYETFRNQMTDEAAAACEGALAAGGTNWSSRTRTGPHATSSPPVCPNLYS